MKKRGKVTLGIVIGIIVCVLMDVLVLYFCFFGKSSEVDEKHDSREKYEKYETAETHKKEKRDEAHKTYEGNNMSFVYNKTLQITSREQENCKNITVNNADGTMVLSSVLIQLDEMEPDTFFADIDEYAEGRKEWEAGEILKEVANDQKGIKYYKEYDILDLDFDEYKALAQVQQLDDNYYLFTLAYIEEDFDANTKLARTIMDSIKYCDVAEPGDLELTMETSPLYQIHSFFIFNVEKNTDIYTDDLDAIYEEHVKSIPADTTLKAVEGYEYLMQRDIASADGNIYQIMIPQEDDSTFEDDKRFISYLDNGISVGMYARLLFEGESLEDFLEISRKQFRIDPEDSDYTNVYISDVIEKDGMLYQFCTAERYNYYGDVVPEAELIAVIPLEGDDTLDFSFSLEFNFGYNSESRKILEELEEYYGLPLTQFADFAEQYPMPDF